MGKMKAKPGNTIKELSPYQHVRAKTEMYFGSRVPHTQTIANLTANGLEVKECQWVPALYTYYREIIDNSLDEIIAHGSGDTLEVEYDGVSGRMSVSDNGRGIPIDYLEDKGCHVATMAVSRLMTGRNFDDRGEGVGTNGIGSKGVNFTSQFFRLEVWRDGRHFSQQFSEGEEELIIADPVITPSKRHTGTKLTFAPSAKVFQQHRLSEYFVESRVREIAAINPSIRVIYNGKKMPMKDRVDVNLFGKLKPISMIVEDDGFHCTFHAIPNFIPEGEHVHAVVNNIPAFNGGIHVDTFKRLFCAGVLEALERESKKRKLAPNRLDVMEGVLIYCVTSMRAPNFDSQSKTRLVNEEVGNTIRRHLANPDIYKDVIRKNREWVEEIYARCAERTNKRDAAETARIAKKIHKNKVAGHFEATGSDRQSCILILAEGDSAIGGVVSNRNPAIHGGLPLRGKVKNVHGAPIKSVLENAALRDIMTSIGLTIGHKADRATLQYGKVFLAHDADPDGLNIGALLVNFFFTYWPELFDPSQEPFIYVFQTPFIIAEKGSKRVYWYSDDYSSFNPDQYKGWTITRAKGLGTLQDADWQHSLANPRLLPMVDDGRLEEVLNLIFDGDRADDRKEWIN